MIALEGVSQPDFEIELTKTLDNQVIGVKLKPFQI